MAHYKNAVCAVLGKSFVMIAADMTHFDNAMMIMEDDVNKLTQISDNVIVSSIGKLCECVRLEEYLVDRHNLYRLRVKLQLSPTAVANLAANYISELVYKRRKVWSLVAGFDNGPQLFMIDTWGSCERLERSGTLGLAGRALTSVLDEGWHPGITQDTAYRLIKKAVRQINHRSAVNLPRFAVAVIDRVGRRDLPPISRGQLALEAHGFVNPAVHQTQN